MAPNDLEGLGLEFSVSSAHDLQRIGTRKLEQAPGLAGVFCRAVVRASARHEQSLVHAVVGAVLDALGVDALQGFGCIGSNVRPGDLVASDFVSAEPLDYYVERYLRPREAQAQGAPTIQRTWVVLNNREEMRAQRVQNRTTQMGAPPLSESTPVFTVEEADVFLFGRSAASADPRLLEAIDWYTGVAGHVDDTRAQELLLEVLEDTDSALARMWLARCYSRGRMGFDRDEDLARSLAAGVIQEIRELAETEEPEAIFLMGTAYDEGLGVEADPATAVEWFTVASETGHVLAAHNIGNAYRVGRGVPLDPEAAVFWWTLAADQGDAITQLRLGEAYEVGNGVETNLEQAVAWYRQSAERGNADARAALERLGG